MHERVTRGTGSLEGFLARRRAAMARRLLDGLDRDGRILDVGCGSSPLFLHSVRFRDRVGLDKLVESTADAAEGIRLVPHDILTERRLPFEDGTFDAVTMLAVFEHIEPGPLGVLLTEIRRVLRPGGRFVMTTPASWTDPILRTLAALGLVSSEEIDEHQDAYDHAGIRRFLRDAGFDDDRIRQGSFELFMNLWTTAEA